MYPDVMRLSGEVRAIVTALVRRARWLALSSTLRRERRAASRQETVHLGAMRAALGNASLAFVTVSGNEYLVEVSHANKARVPADWKVVMSTQKLARYRCVRHCVRARRQRASPAADRRASLRRSTSCSACASACTSRRKRPGSTTCCARCASRRASVCARFRSHARATLAQRADYAALRALVAAVATLDALCALADVAVLPGYARPQLLPYAAGEPAGDGPLLDATQARHPVLETLMSNETSFVPNGETVFQRSLSLTSLSLPL